MSAEDSKLKVIQDILSVIRRGVFVKPFIYFIFDDIEFTTGIG